MTHPRTASRLEKVKHLKELIGIAVTLLTERNLSDLDHIDGRNIRKLVEAARAMVVDTE